MAVKKVDHISILAKNPHKVIDFYKTFFGFRIKSEIEVPDRHMNIYFLTNGTDTIEIIEPTGDELKMADGLKHIAFISDNIQEDFNFFQEKGAKLLHKEVQTHENMNFFFARSPSGEFVEVIQYRG